MIFLLLLTLIEANQFANYGVYCGLYHTDYYGLEPINELDRYCQYHDICVTAESKTSCYCNQQLFWYVSNFVPIDTSSNVEKDTILKYIYPSIAVCSNYYNFDIKYLLSNGFDSVQSGFNYLPLYGIESSIVYFYSSDDIAIMLFNNGTYTQFTHDVYRNASLYQNYDYIKCHKNQKYYINSTNQIVVFYNINPNPTVIYVTHEKYKILNVSFNNTVYVNNTIIHYVDNIVIDEIKNNTFIGLFILFLILTLLLSVSVVYLFRKYYKNRNNDLKKMFILN